MASTDAHARQQLLDALGEAVDDIGAALAALGDAYELLDERSADRLEADLCGPVQAAYGRAKRTHAGFAQRAGLPPRTFAPGHQGAASASARDRIEDAVDAAAAADDG